MAMTAGYNKSLINYLLNRRDFVPGTELSAVLGVSTKTISRIVKHVNEQSANGPIVESQRGRGYRLNSSNYFAQRDLAGEGEKSGALSSVERRDEIIKRLLITAPQQYRMDDLWGKFYISESAIAVDLRTLRRMLAKFKLELARSGDIIWVSGTETDIRRAMASLLVTDDAIANGQFMRADHDVQQRDVAFVSHQLDLIEDLTHAEVPYPYSVNLFTHLYILIERFRGVGSLIDDGEPSEFDEAMLEHHKGVTQVCEKVIGNFDAYLGTTLPRIEVYYLYQYLTSSRIDFAQLDPHEIPEDVREVTDELIDLVTEDPAFRTIDKQGLFAHLSLHMKPLMNRLRNNIRVANNLLEQIKLEYPYLFNVVSAACLEIEQRRGLAHIDDEELGFITVHFAQAVERAPMPLNLLLVCTTGLGTAQLLQAKIAKRFSGFRIVETVSSRTLKQELAKHPDIDLVVSTVRLPEEITVPTLVVSAMLTLEDQDRLEQEANRIRREAMAR
ncbi:BglG family transcription antiterminator [Bifidobacterium saguinibicoloris]|uniref:BglG family transcription antiterminator n=1 Tax=Bifidobacterium saguinibicoloris TaxID=2834433 RepID=UPI001F1989C4|nr:transcription antiterminator [Bifidobacterium saguinibicoloris]